MSEPKTRGIRRVSFSDADKEKLDTQTSYTTFLPHMDEGFNVGYQPVPGVQHDRNNRPGEWLENMARFMRTQGEDVGYSIPDVLASEQQLRRLSRLPHELAMRHQEFIDYRAVLALVLLWDSWRKDETWPSLELKAIDIGSTAFTRSVVSALQPERARDGLRLFTLSRTVDGQTDERPLCLLSRAMVLMPAADAGDLSGLMPGCVRWYDRKRKRFLDPCEFLNEAEVSRLTAQLTVLQALNERPELCSPLYSPNAELCSLFARFKADLTVPRRSWREALSRGGETVENDLRMRLYGVYGLSDGNTAALCQELGASANELAQNPLIRQLMPPGIALPKELSEPKLTIYLLGHTPFARKSDFCVLEPTRFAGEEAALRAIEKDIDLRSRFSPGWNERTSSALNRLCTEASGHVGFSEHALELIAEWARESANVPAGADRAVALDYPIKDFSPSLTALLNEMLGLNDEDCVREPFSDCLLIIEGAEKPPYEHPPLNRSCLIKEAEGAPPRYAVPPLSMRLAAWLQAQSELEDPYAPRLKDSDMSFEINEERGTISASFTIVCKVLNNGAAAFGSVRFRKEYRLSDKPETGAAYPIAASALPYVVSWPHSRIATGLWRQYFVYAHRPEAADVLALTSGGWSRGEMRTASDEGIRRQNRIRTWQTIATDRFPAFAALRRGALSLGVLPGDRRRQQLKLEPPAIVAIDFGSISTTVMMRQGDKVQPAALPRCLHHSLLWSSENDERFLTDELLPKTALLPSVYGTESSYYSVMDMFTDSPEKWRNVMTDGHIYYRENLTSLLRKSENTLYYDLKWGDDDYVLRCVRLFLKQVMAQASLSARLWGSSTVSWRVSMPNALPVHKQEAFLELVRGLSREVAEDTGMPLTKGCPAVLYATENRADGLYFRGRNEVNAQNGYINLDIGGGTTDISLWLGGAANATAECSLRLGCRQMIFDSISMWHIDDFEQDFGSAAQSAQASAQEIAKALREGAATTRGRQKSMFLLDDFFAEYSPDIREALEAMRGEGKVTYIESLLLFNIGFLFCIAGLLMERAWREDELKPKMPARMELCIAGNGGQLLKLFTDEQRSKLCKLALSALSPEHPLKALLPVQSRNPKQEVAIGLLGDEELQSSVVARERWNGTSQDAESADENLLIAYVPCFARLFPQAAKRLMPGRLQGERLTADSEGDIATIFDNERRRLPGDDMSAYVRCLGGLKRLWRI